MPRTNKTRTSPVGGQRADGPAQPRAEKPTSAGRRSGAGAEAKRPARQPRRQPTPEPAATVPAPPVQPAALAAPAAPPFGETGAELRQFREELAAALPVLRSVPRDAGDLRGWLHETSHLLLEVIRQLRETEQHTREARGELERLRRECEAAEQRLAGLRGQAAEAEGRLVALRRETRDAEQRLASIRKESGDAEEIVKGLRREFERAHQWLEERRSQPPGPAPAAEAPNRLGATVDPGVVVAEVLPDSPAERGGLAPGDVIAAVGGTAVFSGEELRELVHAAPAGEELSLRVERAGTFEEVTVRLDPPDADAAADEGHNRLGVTVEPGVVIAEVVPGSPAAQAGLERGDVILQADGTPVVSGPQLRELIRSAATGSAVTLQVDRGDALFVTEVAIER